MIEPNTERKPWHFFILTFAYSWLLWLPSILSGLGVKIPFDVTVYTAIVVPIGAFAPLFAAITLIFQKGRWTGVKTFLRQAFDFRVKPLFYVLALLLPIVIHLTAHYLAPLLGFEVADTLFPAGTSPIVIAIPYFFLMMLIGGGQEEFGWRGYAQQPLQERFGVIPASLLIGVVWGLWHLPLWVMPGDGHSTYPYLAFLIMTTSISLVYAWLFNNSGKKLLIVIIFHAMSNTAAPLLPFLHGQAGKPETAYWVYAGVNVVVGLIFAYLITRDKTRIS
jgi:membrane protease YdiL (CAAX protease family)